MKIKILVLFAVLFVACSTLHFVEPTVAASPKVYLIDQGSQFNSPGEGEYPYGEKVTWKAYGYGKNTIKIVQKVYLKDNGKWKFYFSDNFVLKKISKNKIQIQDGYEISSRYTKLSAADYYWIKFRRGWMIIY